MLISLFFSSVVVGQEKKSSHFLTFARCAGRSADESGLAFASIAAGQVGAHGARTARLLLALVDVDTGGADGFETVSAETLALHALGVVHAVEIAFAQRGHVHLPPSFQNVTTDNSEQMKKALFSKNTGSSNNTFKRYSTTAPNYTKRNR